MQLQNKAAIVTGAGNGLGRAIAEKLAAEGAAVMLADLDGAAADTAAAAITAVGGIAAAVRTDVSDPAEVERMVAETVTRFGRLDVMVSNAGIAGTYPFLEQPLDHWQRVLAVNLTGPLLCGQAAARQMLRQGQGGRIVNIASVSGILAGVGRTAYGTSKAGVIGLTAQMALELGPHRITANAVAPGPVDTEMTRGIHTPETRQAYIERIPAGRYGKPEEIAAAVAFLAGDGAAYINGQVLCVDGGYVSAGIMAADVLAQKR